jgi:hypothetical protein
MFIRLDICGITVCLQKNINMAHLLLQRKANRRRKMKYLLSLMALVFGVTVSHSTYAIAPKMVNITPQAVFVANGFDDNDQVSVTVDGYLPDTCFRLEPALIEKDLANGKIIVQPRAQVFPGICQDMLVPFTTTVSLGSVPQGSFQIATLDGVNRASLQVKTATAPGPDDYLYAPVDSARVQVINSKLHALIQGRFTDTCSIIGEMRLQNSGKTLELLPIMRRDTSAGCEKKEIVFEKAVELPSLATGRYLLHVRSLHGQAVNDVFSAGSAEFR